MSSVVLKNLVKSYDGKKNIIDNINLEIKDKEFIVLVGSSGCGKSTILRLISGLEDITSGEILIDDKVVNNVHPKDRDIAFVFQSYALYPHMSVYDNIAFGLKMRKYDKKTIDTKVREVAESLNLTELLNRKPKQLSGGQRQALTLMMATINPPKLLLLDEHTAALDPATAEKVLNLTTKIVEENKITCLMITHNMQSALDLGNRTIMMDHGQIIFDAADEQRSGLTVEDLLEKFKSSVGKSLNNDRMLLS